MLQDSQTYKQTNRSTSSADRGGDRPPSGTRGRGRTRDQPHCGSRLGVGNTRRPAQETVATRVRGLECAGAICNKIGGL